MIAEYLAILILDFAILRSGGDSGVNLASFSSHHVFSGTPSIGLLFCFAAFIGFEATTIYGEEAKNPQRTIPPRLRKVRTCVTDLGYRDVRWQA